jgi:serine protease Do
MKEGSEFRSFFIKGLIIILVAIIFLVVGGASMLGILAVINKVSVADLLKGESIESEEQVDGNGETLLNELDDAINRVVEEITPSVVNITGTIVQEIFGQTLEQEITGSGVIYTEDGYIITNNHVVEGTENLIVTLNDGSEYPATFIEGEKDVSDVAVIKIEESGLKAARFSTTDSVKVGDIVIAVGSPFWLQQTITMGVVSAKGRVASGLEGAFPKVDLIQTDTAINSGSSGGPLVNSAGQVIGINTFIVSPSGTNAGIGLALPSDIVTNIVDQIIKDGKVRVPYIGVVMGENTTDISGVYIINVEEGTPAEDAGIKSGDIIIKFDGVEVNDSTELFGQILRHNVDDLVNIEIYRNGKYLNITLELIENPQTSSDS